MSLANLLRIGKLETHETDASQVRQMLQSARRSFADARQNTISPETRLDAGYRAVMQVCMVALWVNGYRPSKSAPGHHQTMIQSLVHSISLDRDQMLLLDTFRLKRNAIDYTGECVDAASVEQCIAAAGALLRDMHAWLSTNKPDLAN